MVSTSPFGTPTNNASSHPDDSFVNEQVNESDGESYDHLSDTLGGLTLGDVTAVGDGGSSGHASVPMTPHEPAFAAGSATNAANTANTAAANAAAANAAAANAAAAAANAMHTDELNGALWNLCRPGEVIEGYEIQIPSWMVQHSSFYIVFNGRKTGVFPEWSQAAHQVNGFSCNSHISRPSADVAWAEWKAACLDGRVTRPTAEQSLFPRIVTTAELFRRNNDPVVKGEVAQERAQANLLGVRGPRPPPPPPYSLRLPGHNNIARAPVASSSAVPNGAQMPRTSSSTYPSTVNASPSPKIQSPAANTSCSSTLDNGCGRSAVAESSRELMSDNNSGARSSAAESAHGSISDSRGPRAGDRRTPRPLVAEHVRNWMPERRGSRPVENTPPASDRRTPSGLALTASAPAPAPAPRPSSPAMSAVSHSSHASGTSRVSRGYPIHTGPAYVVIIGRRPGVYTNVNQWQDAMTNSREGWAWPCESAEEAIDAYLAFRDDVRIVN